MEKMMVIVFDNEKQAYAGAKALVELDAEGSIALHAEAIIQKNQDGTVSVKQAADDLPIRTIGGTAIGSLIGLLGGPVGLAIGFGTGAAAGMLADAYVAGVGDDFLNEVATLLVPGKCAVVADLSEEWVTPVDVRMEILGGVVIRREKQQYEDEMCARDIAALREEIAQLKAEHQKANSERKAKLQAKIDTLERKLQAKVDQAKQRSEHLKNETDAKIKALQNKVKADDRQALEAINARIAAIRQRYDEAESNLRLAIAGQLKKAAAKIEKAG
jgi:uncharacterized membrane protein